VARRLHVPSDQIADRGPATAVLESPILVPHNGGA
jgi:hypothetical protein